MLKIVSAGIIGFSLTVVAAASSEATPLLTQCGGPVSSSVKTETALTRVDQTTFATIPGGNITVNVPKGATECIKVEFDAVLVCGVSSDETCTFRALDNGVQMNPAQNGEVFVSGDLNHYQSRGFKWVRRVGAGRHVIRIQAEESDNEAGARIDAWTMDVEVTH